jgi:protein subunit release factor A
MSEIAEALSPNEVRVDVHTERLIEGGRTWVQVTHLPTGASVACSAFATQRENRDRALADLAAVVCALAAPTPDGAP